MRIDSLSFYNAGLAGLSNNQSSMARLNQQIASGQALLAAKDDPVTMIRIMELTDSVALRSQYAANQTKAGIALKYESTVLTSLDGNIRSIRALIAGVSPGNDTLNRSITAEQMSALFAHLRDLANARDTGGNFIFAGDRTNLPASTPPFLNAGGGSVPATVPITGMLTSYNGDAAVRGVEIDMGRQVQVSDNLNSVLQAGVAGADLLQTVDEAVQRLPADATLSNADLSRYLSVIDTALNNLASIQYRIAGAQTAIAEVRKSTQAMLLNDKNTLGDLSRVDQAKAIVELQARQTSLEAAGRAYAMTSGLSLFKYL